MEIRGNFSFIKQVGKTVTERKILLKALAYSPPLFAKKKKKSVSLLFKIQFSTTVTAASIFLLFQLSSFVATAIKDG